MGIHRPKIDSVSKKIFSVIHIPTQYQHDILISAGYKPHHNLNGWIKNLSGASRFHAVEDKENFIYIHLDQTVNGRHRVARGKEYGSLLKLESQQIRRLWKEVDPIEALRRIEKEESKKRKKNRYPVAPNYQSLVKGQQLEIIRRAPVEPKKCGKVPLTAYWWRHIIKLLLE